MTSPKRFAEKFMANRLRRLDRITRLQRLAFAASCCEIMIADYEGYTALGGKGDFALLRSALDGVWQTVRTGKHPFESTDELVQRIYSVTPGADNDDGDVATWLDPMAMDAGLGVASAAALCSDEIVPEIIRISDYAIYSIQEYLLTVNIALSEDVGISREMNDFVYSCPLFIAEITRQDITLQLLGETDGIADQLFRIIRHYCAGRGIQPLLRGLVQR